MLFSILKCVISLPAIVGVPKAKSNNKKHKINTNRVSLCYLCWSCHFPHISQFLTTRSASGSPSPTPLLKFTKLPSSQEQTAKSKLAFLESALDKRLGAVSPAKFLHQLSNPSVSCRVRLCCLKST